VLELDGLGKRVQVFIEECDSIHGKQLYLAILEKLKAEGAAGGTVTKGIAGFGAHGRIHTAHLVDLAVPLPLVVTWVDAPAQVERLLPIICDMVGEGLVTVEDVTIVKYTHRDAPK
jgi:PII-like signaling protein